MTKLKDCPFCGGKATRDIRTIDECEIPHYFEVQARCEQCGAEIRRRHHIPCWVKNPEREAKRYISNLWNRRVNNG